LRVQGIGRDHGAFQGRGSAEVGASQPSSAALTRWAFTGLLMRNNQKPHRTQNTRTCALPADDRAGGEPSPQGEGCGCRRARSRPAMIATFSAGRRWTATGVLTSRRGPDEGSGFLHSSPLRGERVAAMCRRVRGHFRRLDHRLPATHNCGWAV
jgi:hypothetical protein